VTRKFFLSAFLLVICSDVIKDFEWKINREGAEERERKKHHIVSCFSFYIFVNFMVTEGLFFEQKCLFIVIKGTTVNCTDNIETAEHKNIRKEIFTKKPDITK